MNTPKINIAHKLKEVRQRKSLTQKSVATGIGINWKVYQSYEEGRAKPSITTLLDLAFFYGLFSIDELIGLAEIKGQTQRELLQAYHESPPPVRKIVDFALNLNC